MVSETLEGIHRAVDAFQRCILLTQSPWSIHLHSDQVAVHHFFYPFPPLPLLFLSSQESVLHVFMGQRYVLFFIPTNTSDLGVFGASSGPKSPG